MTEPRLAYIGFNLVKGIGAARMRTLLDIFGDVDTAWQASGPDLRNAGLSQRIVDNLLQVRAEVDLTKTWERLERLGISVLTWDDPLYPSRLSEIEQPPPVLYIRGKVIDEDSWAVALVGTRNPTAYGRQVAGEIAETLARSGVTVVSGLARGIDAAAHQACLEAGGRTLAVLGSGVDLVYPPEHRQLAQKISAQGALVSDYAPGTPPDAANFPPRNRIISGLARAVIVVEAGEKSGALITAAFAADQGREVYAVPGGIYSPLSKGTNRLIQEGARPMLDCEELLSSLKLGPVTEFHAARSALPMDATETHLLELLGNEALHVDEISQRSNLPVEKISAALVMLELKGMVRQMGGMQFMAIRETGDEYRTG
ncbi:MAG TPA: DNA-processing protein DprA [Anaerolineales bacterium]|nr:DNA-processing protein DprA [Anaerolineales bacterium]